MLCTHCSLLWKRKLQPVYCWLHQSAVEICLRPVTCWIYQWCLSPSLLITLYHWCLELISFCLYHWSRKPVTDKHAIDVWSPSSVGYIYHWCLHSSPFSYTIVVGDPLSNEYTIDDAIIAVCGPSFVDPRPTNKYGPISYRTGGLLKFPKTQFLPHKIHPV